MHFNKSYNKSAHDVICTWCLDFGPDKEKQLKTEKNREKYIKLYYNLHIFHFLQNVHSMQFHV